MSTFFVGFIEILSKKLIGLKKIISIFMFIHVIFISFLSF